MVLLAEWPVQRPRGEIQYDGRRRGKARNRAQRALYARVMSSNFVPVVKGHIGE
jgi:hypothetical protein